VIEAIWRPGIPADFRCGLVSDRARLLPVFATRLQRFDHIQEDAVQAQGDHVALFADFMGKLPGEQVDSDRGYRV
jgi:hypothetical protein